MKLFSIMERFLRLVEEPSQQDEVQIDEKKLKQSLSKVEVWDYAMLTFTDYQRLSVDDRSSILKNYYNDMVKKYSGPGKYFIFHCMDVSFGFFIVVIYMFLLLLLFFFV